MSDNYYKILQVPYNATTKEISKAYRKLALIYHPDNKKTGNIKIFVKISNAYNVLSNPQAKLEYDTELSMAREKEKENKARSGENFEDRLDYIKTKLYDLLKKRDNVSSGEGYRKKEKKLELHKIKISFAESIKGSLRYVYTRKQYLCTSCNGKGGKSKIERCIRCGGLGIIGSKVAVYVKPYTQNNEIISIQGLDIKVQILIVNNHHYVLDGKNRVIMKVPITLSESIEGCIVEVLSPNLNLLKLSVPPKTRSGSLLKISNSKERDIDFYIKVYIQTPVKIRPIELDELKKIEKEMYQNDLRKQLKNI